MEVDAVGQGSDTTAFVDDLLGRPGRHIAGHQVAERRVATLEEVVTLVDRDFGRSSTVAYLFGHPNPSVVAQRLGHQCELRLEFVTLRDAGGVDLRETRVGGQRPLSIRPPGRGAVA